MSDDEKTVRDGFLSTVVNEIATGDPPETKATYDRLRADGLSDSEALQLIGLVLRKEMQQMIKESRPFDREHYAAQLSKLPDLES